MANNTRREQTLVFLLPIVPCYHCLVGGGGACGKWTLHFNTYCTLRYDYLQITNEKGKLFGTLCGGPYVDVNTEVTGNYARLIFHSDSDLEKRGFLLHFTVVPLPGKNQIFGTVCLISLLRLLVRFENSRPRSLS